MIEVRGIPQLVGARLTLTAHREVQTVGTQSAIHQTLQLTTRGIARRLIRIDFPCQRFLVEVNVPLPASLDGFGIELVRVSAGFARSRMHRALHGYGKNSGGGHTGRKNLSRENPSRENPNRENPNRENPHRKNPNRKNSDREYSGRKDAGTNNGFLSGSIDSMYRRYRAMSAMPSINTMYPGWLLENECKHAVDIHGQSECASTCLSDYGYNLTSLPNSESLTKATGYCIELITDRSSGAPYSPLQEQWVIVRQKRASLRWQCLNDALDKLADSKGLTLAYADHDYTGADEARIHPCFKPGWNPGLLRQGNYIGAVILVTRSAYDSTGGLDASMGASALYDLLLRISRTLSDYEVLHINEMLFSLPARYYYAPHGFTVARRDPHALERFANDEKLSRGTRSPTVLRGPYPGTFQLRYSLPVKVPSVDIIIPTRDQSALLERCVKSILALTAYAGYTITVVDNDSEQADTLRFHKAYVQNEARYRMLHFPGAFNYSAINNEAVRASTADVIVLLNNDTEITQSHWLAQLVTEATQPDVACAGAKLLYANGLVQHAGVVAGMHGVAGHVNRFMDADEDGYAGMLKLSPDMSAVTAACLAIRRSVYLELNGLDAVNLPVAFNDVDLCLRARELGYRNRFLAQVTVIHHESVSRGHDDSKQKATRFQQEVDYMRMRHKYWIADDPAWNSNFSRQYHFPVLSDSIAHDADSQPATLRSVANGSLDVT